MRIRVYSYSIPFRSPVTTASETLQERSGFIMRIDESDRTGWGEAAPLDGYSPDTTEMVAAALPQAVRELSAGASASDASQGLPSLECAAAFALEELTSSQSSEPIPSVPTACLLNERDDERLLAGVTRAIKEGYRCLKIKVGRQEVREDIADARMIQDAVPQGVTLRFDANRAWSLDQAVLFSRMVEPAGVAFVEEPLRDPDDYGRFDGMTELPFALDESLLGREAEKLAGYRNLAAVVLKPSLLGGPLHVRKWAAQAAASGVGVVLSAMYETGVGMRSLLRLAAALRLELPAGLDTYRALGGDIATPALALTGGSFAADAGWLLEESKLELIHDND